MGLTIIDYIGNSDKDGNPIGHPIKTINNYIELFEGIYELQLIVPLNYKSKLSFENIYFLNYFQKFKKYNYVLKIINIFRRYNNINKSIKLAQNEVLWFMNIDFVLFIYLILNNINKKVIITSYSDEDIKKRHKVLNFFNKTIKKNVESQIDLYITSNPNFNTKKEDKIVYIPDYIYLEKYKYYEKEFETEDYILCIGVMNNSKKLVELVEVFNKTNYSLKIVGKFTDLKLLKAIQKNANDNIEIRNEYVDESDYYKLISKSKYVILPYKKEYYYNRSSGVLLDSIFLRKTVIAPSFIFEYNEIEGIKYNKLEELKNKNLIFVHNNLKPFDKEIILNKLSKKLKKLMEE